MFGRAVLVDPLQVQPKISTSVLRAEQDLRSQAQRLRSQLEVSVRTLHVSPANVRRVVDRALALAEQRPLVDGLEPGTITPPDLRLGWERTLEGLADPLSGELRPLTLSLPCSATGPMSCSRSSATRWSRRPRACSAAPSGGGTGSLHRVAAVRFRPPAELAVRGPVVLVFARLVVVGGDGGRPHEEIVLAARELPESGRSKRLDLEQKAYGALRSAVEAALEPEACRLAPAGPRERLTEQWEELTPLLVEDLRRRAEAQLSALHTDLERQAEQALSDTRARYDQLRQTLRSALEGPGDVQLQLGDLDAPERTQVERDRQLWQDRLDAIDVDVDRDAELAPLTARFGNVRELVFPFAVVLTIPE